MSAFERNADIFQAAIGSNSMDAGPRLGLSVVVTMRDLVEAGIVVLLTRFM
jgi:hypothetical protein